jgi:peptide/nickel transport system substrate-binding protein
MHRPLIIGVDQLPANFDMEQPEGFHNRTGADLFQNTCEQLTSPHPVVDDGGVRRIDWHHLEPRLAETWWFSEDGRCCTFRLRRGVLSHDGHELTAGDVKWGWDRAFALRDVGKWVARISSVQYEHDVEVLDRYTVAFHLAAPNPALPRTMAQCTPSVYDTAAVQPHVDADDPWAKNFLRAGTAGYGAYWLAAASSDEITLRANEKYYRGRPAIAVATIRELGSDLAAAEAVAAGQVDLAFGLFQDEAFQLRGRSDVRIVACAITPGVAVGVDTTSPPFDNPLVRQALACAVPYQEIIQTAYLGGARRWRSWLQPEAPGYADDLWPYEEDPDRARELLTRAGYGDGFSTRLAVAADSGLEITARLLCEALGRVGIDVATDPADKAPLRLRAGGSRGHRVFDPSYGLYHDFGPGRMRLSPSSYENQEFYDALRAIPEAGHGEPWERAVREAQHVLLSDVAAIPICAPVTYIVHRAGLAGYRWYPDNRLPLFDMRWQ